MKYLDEYRDPELVRKLVAAIENRATRRWTMMEICGGQTHAFLRDGLDGLIASRVELIHGPGCPVCVTPLERIDRALAIASRPEVIFTTFGDMLRVPGSTLDLARVRARGGDVRFVYSPLDTLEIAAQNPDREVVFFAVGFETTIPATALTVHEAKRRGIANLSVLVSHMIVPPAVDAILGRDDSRIDGLLAAGHVCAIMGHDVYPEIAQRRRVPIVIAGFEPTDLLEGVLMLIDQLETGRHELENQYRRAVRPEGNVAARRMIDEVYEPADQTWRGIGLIPSSGVHLRSAYRAFDAVERFEVGEISACEPATCRAGDVLVGRLRPQECPEFGVGCTPESPLGAPMVSAEGACSAHWRYARRSERVPV
ncbi:MAG: hydrogenase formation protein HypD [Isosphaeraceae bacterium]|nr:hydrogenase formation protein HypD [Isosphaeraceae bacterium]